MQARQCTGGMKPDKAQDIFFQWRFQGYRASIREGVALSLQMQTDTHTDHVNDL